MADMHIDLYNSLKAIVAKYESAGADNAQVVKLKDDIIAACKKYGFCNQMILHCKAVGPHPANRDGEGISAERAQTRVKVIKAGGFSLATLRPNCIAMEENPIKRHIGEFAEMICSRGPTYARLNKGMIRAGTLGAGHATHGFAQLHDEVPCTIAGISENGIMSKALCFEDAGIKNAVENGIEFDVIDYRVEVAFPKVPEIVQSALNVVQQVSAGESWHQMLLKIVNQANVSWPKVDWKLVKKNVLKSQPARQDDVPDMVDFVAKWGGLPTGMHIKNLAELCSAFVSPDRIVSGNFFRWLADLPMPATKMPAEFINAIIFTHAKSEHNVQDGFARCFAKGDVLTLARVGSNTIDNAMAADRLISRTRGLLAASNVPKSKCLSIMSELYVTVVESTLTRKGSTETRTIPVIADEFAKLVSDTCVGSPTVVLDPLIADASTPVTPDHCGLALNAVTYAADGSVSGIGKTMVRSTYRIHKWSPSATFMHDVVLQPCYHAW